MYKVCIQIVTLNSKRFLKDCIDSVFNQKFQDFSVLIIDNGSNDGTIEFVNQRYFKQKDKKRLFILQNNKNVGFSKAHNQGFKITKSKYVLIVNPDIILNPDFLQKLFDHIDVDNKIGCVGGKLLKIEHGDVEVEEKIKKNVIDSTSIKILKSRRIINQGEGEYDKGQYDGEHDVFGISGACALFRKKTLDDVIVLTKHGYEYFDEDFFAYKEDADLAWRIKLRKWRTIYVPEAIAYHFRAGAPLAKRFKQTEFIALLSYVNQVWVILKNEHVKNFFTHLPFILAYQFVKKMYLLFTNPKVLFKAGSVFFKNFVLMYKKRKYILKRAKIGHKEIKQWFQ